MGNNILKMYYETTTGFLSLFLVERVYTEDDELISSYRTEIFDNNEEGVRSVQSVKIFSSPWTFNFTTALDKGIQECYERGAIKLLFVS